MMPSLDELFRRREFFGLTRDESKQLNQILLMRGLVPCPSDCEQLLKDGFQAAA